MINGNLALQIIQDTPVFTEKQIAILNELKATYMRWADGAESCQVFVYANFYWDELTDLAAVCDYVRYTPPPVTNMWVSGRHEIMASIATWEAPAKPSTLTILEKPAPVCPSALREPKMRFSQAGRSFEALKYDNESRIFQDLATGQTYHLVVKMDVVGNVAMTASFINGRVVSTQDYLIMPQFAGRTFRYLAHEEQALLGAYDNLQRLVLSGRA